MVREFKLERNIKYTSKCEFFINVASVAELQKALPVIDGGENSFIYKQAFKIERNVPAFPLASPMYGFTQQAQGCQPQIKNLVCTSWGQEFEGSVQKSAGQNSGCSAHGFARKKWGSRSTP